MSLLEQAIVLAIHAHEGQADKQGRPYILHPLRVMHSFTGQEEDDEARIASVLHDVVEDCEITVEGLGAMGFPPAAVEAIDALSRRKGETYDEYLIRVQANPLAVRVKLAELVDNLDPNRPSTAMIGSEQRDKYLAAWKLLRLHQKRAEGIPEFKHS
jgi:(p)ppGpp synthase/HD superfamily hydrolase